VGYKIVLDNFEGPIELLLHLIETQELNIYDIPIARITDQYLEYLRAMRELDLDIASEFLVMAATLMQIKARMLLPAHREDQVEDETEEKEEGPDPRDELVRRLVEYKVYKEAAEKLQGLEETQRRRYYPTNHSPGVQEAVLPAVKNLTLANLAGQFLALMREQASRIAEIYRDRFTLKEKVWELWQRVKRTGAALLFSRLLGPGSCREETVITFLALLELIRQRRVRAQQSGCFGEILITPCEFRKEKDLS